jgi:protein-disulfide isomerase
MSNPDAVSPLVPRWRSIFEVSTTVVMVAMAGALLWQSRARFVDSPAPGPRNNLAVPRDPIAIAGKPTLGSSTARIAILEFADFECPFCGVVARETIPTLIREYVETGKVILVFRNLPLAMHPLARNAAAAAFCAGQQGRFWQMHDRLFAQASGLADRDMRTYASQLALDLALYDSCRATTASAALIEADSSEAGALKITGTPTFIFGRVESDGRVRATDVLSGAKPIANFRAVLDRLLE